MDCINEYSSTIFEYEKKPLKKLFKLLVKKFKQYSSESPKKLKEAFDLGVKVHEKHTRESGVPYFTHPLAVALILTPYHADSDTLISTLLHDVFEDSDDPHIRKKVLKQFGENVTHLIEGVSKVTKQYEDWNKTKESQETIRKMLRLAEKDTRLLLIKIADRVHNIITLGGKKDSQKRQKKAQETLEIFVPLASRLGLWELKRQLEDNCFFHLFPKEFEELNKNVKGLENKVNKLWKHIKTHIQENIAKVKILNIEKDLHTYSSLYNHFKTEKLFNIEDLFRVKIIVQKEEDCYKILSRMNHIFARQLDSFKDYISTPKDNGYKAIHTTMIVKGTYPVEFAITTEEMDKTNTFGVSLDYKKKQFKHTFLKGFKAIDKATVKQSKHFVQAIQQDLLEEKIIVHCKKSTNTYIPKNSTALDAIFFLYPKQKERVESIYINNKQVPFNHAVKNGDLIKGKFGKEDTANIHWLHSLNTNSGKIKLQHFLKQGQRSLKIQSGQNMLQSVFDEYSQGDIYVALQTRQDIYNHYKVETLEELFILVAEGLIRPFDILHAFLQEKREKKSIWKKALGFLFPIDAIKSFGLRIKAIGNKSEKEDIHSTLSKIYKKHDITCSKSIHTEFADGDFNIKLNVKSPNQSNLNLFFLELQRVENISRVQILLSYGIIIQLVFLLTLSILAWTVFFAFIYYITHLLETQSLLVYLGIIPVLIAHFFTYRFINHYFPMVRYNRLFVILFFFINAVAIGIYSLILLKFNLDFFHLSVFLPLSLLIISSLIIIFIFLKPSTQPMQRMNISDKTWREIKKKKMLGYFIRFFAVVIWGIEPIYIKYTVTNTIDPSLRVFLNSCGLIIPSFILGLFAFLFLKKKPIQKKLPFNKFFALIIFGQISLIYFLNSGLVFTSGTNIILLNNFAPVIALIAAVLLWRSTIPYLQKKKHVLAIFLTFIIGSLGSTLLFYNDIKHGTSGNLYGNFLGIFMMIADVILIVSQIQYVKGLKQNQSVSLNFHIGLFCIAASLPLIFSSAQSLFSLSPEQVLYGIGAGVLVGIGYILNFEAFRLIDGFLAFLMFNISIFITFFLEAFIIQNIVPTILLIIGGAMIMAASIVAEYINSRAEKMGYIGEVT